MSIELLVDFREFWPKLRADIQAAQDSVWVQTFALEGDSVGRELAAALIASPAGDKRILADSFTRIVLSDRFRYWPSNVLDPELRREARETASLMSALKSSGVLINFTNPYGATPRRLLSRNHKKLIVIDQRVAYFGGINFSEHNAAWHDMMFRLEDREAVSFLHRDFMATWKGRDLSRRRQFAGLEVLTADGRNNRAAFQRVIDFIDGARRSIFVESPYITFPFYERLRLAARRGVAVTVLTPAENNWGLFADYARLESARSQIDLRLFTGGMSHLKAMLIDDEYLIAGSSNFDYLSYRIHQELIALITAPEVIGAFRERVMLPDVMNSIRVECHAGSSGTPWLTWQRKLLEAAVSALT
ncbi:MAG TPA: phosphatidylserine/phosphatidylglycerophosphate/cardiolipin synthase family protein [Pyrinomonadaceae bacterium]|nr:phosphatidylserine/phosphatidylglycerophosphate/cardiolipin synthase family protein [Pyrinomonadaceae bacterium]